MLSLLKKFHQRLALLGPDVYARLQDERRVTGYLNSFLQVPGDPENALCQALSHSRFDYLADLLEEEFTETYLRFSSAGILSYELINLAAVCAPVFLEYGFPENEYDRRLRYALTGTIAEYLEGGTEDGL
jgi:hypothetical protein